MKPWIGLLLLGVVAFPRPLSAQDDAAIAKGHEIYQRYCTPCHGSGAAKVATTALGTRYKDQKPALLDQRTDLTPTMVKYFVRNGVFLMAKFRKAEISDSELDALASYVTRTDKSKPVRSENSAER
jgi:mono/diheme cytochrome c family protein